MRKLLSLLALVVLAAVPAFAQHEHHHNSGAVAPESMTAEQWRQLFQERVGRPMKETVVAPITSAPTAPAAAKTFNVTERSFVIEVSPSPFVVNQGDNVTLNIHVPSGDTTHGLLMEQYITSGKTVTSGSTVTVQFTANVPGEFTYACSVPACGGGHSAMIGNFTVTAQAQNPAPTISSITPAQIPTTGGTITITGTNFASGATVTIGGVAATNVNVVSATQITATAPVHAAGQVTVTVTNSDSQSASGNLTYVVAGPSISSITPSTGPTSGGTNITISGTGFESGATVTIGGRPALNVNVVSATTITATTPLGVASEQATQPQDVVVKNPSGSTATKAGGFTYSVPALSITAMLPTSGNEGTEVVINGTGFTTALASSITFGGVAAKSVTIVDPVTIRAVAPAHANGGVDVKLTIGNSTVTSATQFTYMPTPPKRRSSKH